MNDWVASDRLGELVAALLMEGILPESELKELEAMLAADENAREYYVLSQELHTMLEVDKSVRLQLAADLLPENVIPLPGVDVSNVAISDGLIVVQEKSSSVSSKSAFRLATSMAAMIAGLLVLVFMYGKVDEFTNLAFRGEGGSDNISFHDEVLPILNHHCFECHGEDDETRKADLRFDVGKSAFQGDEPAIVCGDPEKSLLVKRISSRDPEYMMPPPDFNHPLSDSQISLLKKWIQSGAKYDSEWSNPQRDGAELLFGYKY